VLVQLGAQLLAIFVRSADFTRTAAAGGLFLAHCGEL
jgi:hypothetical protein